MKKAGSSLGIVEIRIPQHGPLTTTAPEREELEAPINNLIERKFGFIHRFRNPELSNQDGNSRSTSVAVEAAGSLEDVVLRKPDLVQEKDRLLVLQQWEGIIIEVYFDVFHANLIDLTAGASDVSDEAELPIGDFSVDDRKILQQGSVFRWLIGYRTTPRGTRQRFSSIFLRRIAAPTEDEISEITKEARQLAASIRWE